jgi:hypothetical protein
MEDAASQASGQDAPVTAPPAMSPPAARVQRCAEWVAAVCVAAGALLCLWHGVSEARLPFQLDYEEGNILNAGVRIVHGLTPYPDPGSYPNALNPYGPVGYFLVALCVQLGGVGFTLGRFVIMASGVAIVLALWLLIREWTGSRTLAAVFGLYFLANGVSRLWLPLLRVDLLALALALAGLWLCLRNPERWWLLSAILFSLALYVKYTALAAPAAAVLWLAARGNWKRAAALAGTMAAICLMVFYWFQVATDGHFFFHMFRTHADPYSLRRLIKVFSLVRFSLLPLAPLLLAFLLLRARRALPVALYLLCATGVVLVTAGKEGSALNHFLELLAAGSLAAALGYQSLAELRSMRIVAPVFVLAVGGAALYFGGAFTAQARVVPLKISGCADLYRQVRESPSPLVLSENVGAVVLAGKEPVVSNPFVLTYLVRSRVLPNRPLENAVADQAFGLIVLSMEPQAILERGSNRWWGRLAEAMDRNYSVANFYDCEDGNFLLTPKPRNAVAPAGPP